MKDQSGPVFPSESGPYMRDGMTKRELIAMSQMKALRMIRPNYSAHALALDAIEDAQALLAELGRE